MHGHINLMIKRDHPLSHVATDGCIAVVLQQTVHATVPGAITQMHQFLLLLLLGSLPVRGLLLPRRHPFQLISKNTLRQAVMDECEEKYRDATLDHYTFVSLHACLANYP